MLFLSGTGPRSSASGPVHRTVRVSIAGVTVFACVTAVAAPASASGAKTSRVSVTTSGAQGNDHSFGPTVSPDGRYVAFASTASNLVPSDTNGFDDVFIRDRRAGTTSRVSLSSTGSQGNHASFGPMISADGRYVAFTSYATNLVPGDTDNVTDVFIRDRRAGTTSLISQSTGGVQANDFSAGAAVSADGRYVAFYSLASNLVPGDTNGAYDAFVRDRRTGTTSRVSLSWRGAQTDGDSIARAMTPDGRYIVFQSAASNLVPGDTNDNRDMFIHDRRTGTISRVSISSRGVQADSYSDYAAISADGRYVAFASTATNLVPGDTNTSWDVFLRDRRAGTTRRVSLSNTGSQGNHDSLGPTITADGRYIVLYSAASNLVPHDTNDARDVFIQRRHR